MLSLLLKNNLCAIGSALYNRDTMTRTNNLILQQMEIGPMQNFQYFVGDAATGEIAVVDPAWDVNFLCTQAKKQNFKITSVFLTHGHPDHTNGLDELLTRYDVPVYLSKYEAPFYKPQHVNIVEVEDRQKLKIGHIAFECLLTPGHTPGCQCFRYQNILITGDTIFIDGCGRCDLPGGNAKQMYASLYNIVMKLPDSTILYPGHNYGPTSSATLGSQKKTNPYLSCKSLDEFLSQRMGIAL